MARWPLAFAALLGLVVAAACCAVGVQYGMKLMVDTIALDDRQSWAIWRSVALFIALIALEGLFWRMGGWLARHTIVSTGVDIRLDLFRHLAGHPMR